jgi:hypothetical protein
MVSASQRHARRDSEGEQSNEDAALEARARLELLSCTYGCVRNVACRLRNGVLTLQGYVPSYFHKQVAQSVLLQRLDRVVPIDNQLRVVGTQR